MNVTLNIIGICDKMYVSQTRKTKMTIDIVMYGSAMCSLILESRGIRLCI